MRAGELRHRCTLQARADTQDDVGQPIPAWSTVEDFWGFVEPLSGREFFAGAELADVVDTRITRRYRAGLDATMRVIFRGVTYDIQSVVDVEAAHREHVLMCKSGLTSG